jgi:hypothetical protein
MPAYAENVRSPGQTGSRRGPAKPTRMTPRRTLGVGQRAAAREKGSGRPLADPRQFDVLQSGLPAGDRRQVYL